MILHGLQNIGAHFSRSRITAWRWVKREGMPVCKAPNGEYMTSTELLDQWMLARGEAQRQQGYIPDERC